MYTIKCKHNEQCQGYVHALHNKFIMELSQAFLWCNIEALPLSMSQDRSVKGACQTTEYLNMFKYTIH